MHSGDEFDALNSVRYLYLRTLSEPRDNSLRIIADEAVANPASPVQLPGLPNIRGESIEPVDGCKSFELYWKNYVACLVTEEMAGSCGKYDDEAFTGRIFRTYSQSHFLEHLAKDTGAHEKPISHYKLTCLNHLVDVASYEQPDIRITQWSSDKARAIPNIFRPAG